MTQLGLNPFYFAWMQLFFAKPEQIVIKVEIFELTLGMENIFLIHVHVYHLVMFLYQLRDIILN